MPNFTLALFNLTDAAPTVANISLQKDANNNPPTFSIVDGEPITARGSLVGTLELDPSGADGLSRNSLELAYNFAPRSPGGRTVLVQFGIAKVKANAEPYPYIGAAGAAPGMVTESYVVESKKQGVYVGLVIIRFITF